MKLAIDRGVLTNALFVILFAGSGAALALGGPGGDAAAAAAAAKATADAEWPMYNKEYDGQRYSTLDQINTDNVGALREVCRVRVDKGVSFHSGPIVVNGIMYVTTDLITEAINPVTCDVVWKNIYTPDKPEHWFNNRGVAYADGRLFRGTGDDRVLALDAKTGKELWRVVAGDPKVEWFAAAPLVWHGMVFLGVAGAEWGIKGRIMAFDAKTGKRLWTFNLVPQGKEFGVDTWKGDSWKTGGGGTWSTVTLDEATGELFIPVANAAADFERSARGDGSNLFTDSVVVLDARSGKLKWWYQATINDDKDRDIGAAPMLFSMANGHRAVAIGSKDGYLHVVDRETHKLVYKSAVTTINNVDAKVTPAGVHVCPGSLGGVQWNGPAFDPQQKTIVVGAVDWCGTFKSEKMKYKYGDFYYGGTWQMDKTPGKGWINAFDADSGKLRWKFAVPAPVVSAITPTAGGIVFAGDMNGSLYALRSADGEVLKTIQTGGPIAGGIVTYTITGKQYVALNSGNISRVPWGNAGIPSVIVYTVGEAPQPEAGPTAPLPSPDGDKPNEPTANTAKAHLVADAAHGKAIYNRICIACHGASGEGQSGPPLKGIGKRLNAEQLLGAIKNPKPPMPVLYPSVLNEQDVTDVAAFVGSR